MKSNLGLFYAMTLMMGGEIGMPRTRERKICLNENSSKEDILYWFRFHLSPEEQLKIVQMKWERQDKEDMHSFLKRRHIQRTILKYVEKHHDDKNLKYKQLVTISESNS